MRRIIFGDNVQVLSDYVEGMADLIYIDPPFNTGRRQSLTQIKTVRDGKGDRTGFAGRQYKTIELGTKSYADTYDDFGSFLIPRLQLAHRLLKPTGSLFVHLDCREVHYCKVWLDEIFGREQFKNEIIWAYDYGGRAKDRWPAKHDNILWYTKTESYTFNRDDADRLPYMAPNLVGPEKAARGKFPTDVWWNTIVCGKEKTGYPTQKPLALIRRIVRVHSNPGELIVDFFAGSGTVGAAADECSRNFLLVDNNMEAVQVMRKRLSSAFDELECIGF